ncbi:hypothetical protein D4R51_02390, partial [bacterium]
MKPFIKIGLIALIIAVIGLIIYFVWSALATPPPEIPIVPPGPDLPIAPPGGGGAENGGENGSSSVQTATLSKISENPVFDFWVDPQT